MLPILDIFKYFCDKHIAPYHKPATGIGPSLVVIVARVSDTEDGAFTIRHPQRLQVGTLGLKNSEATYSSTSHRDWKACKGSLRLSDISHARGGEHTLTKTDKSLRGCSHSHSLVLPHGGISCKPLIPIVQIFAARTQRKIGPPTQHSLQLACDTRPSERKPDRSVWLRTEI